MKIAGAVMLVAACGMFGYAQLAAALRRERLVEAMCSSLELLRAEIATRLTPLPDCARMLSASGPAPCREFYSRLDSALDALGELEFSYIWSACLSTLDLPSDAHSALDDLGRSLGRYSAAEQHTAIDRCIAALERCSRAERETGRGNAKLKLGLSLTAGLLLAVILY